MKTMKKLIGFGLFAGLCTNLSADPVDLSRWTAEGTQGGYDWQVAADNNSVLQTVNSSPTVFYSDFDGQGIKLSGKIEVQTYHDDDYIGFVLGFEPGDVSASATDFILVDWKQSNQEYYGCTGQVGLAISRVTGGLPDNKDIWCHTDTVEELARGSSLGSTGWQDYTEYTFDIVFNSTNIQVWVEGFKEIDINGTFQNGRFGFYNYSQEYVRYSALQAVQPPKPPVPEPVPLALMGLGVMAMSWARRKKA
jgi:hypothetical protein